MKTQKLASLLTLFVFVFCMAFQPVLVSAQDKKETKKETKMDKKESKMDKKESKMDKKESKMDKKESKMDKKDSKMDKKESKMDKKESKMDKKESGASVQCSAKTKEGDRCKRMTTDKSGLCWQHKK
jgi:uncharacterized membrane protein YhiD involved in acid resistance